MSKAKRSSLKADPLYFKAFRIRNSPDPSPRSTKLAPMDSSNDPPDASPTQQRTTIKLVQPSPPPSSTSTVPSRSVSAESQGESLEMANENLSHKSTQNHKTETFGSGGGSNKNDKVENTAASQVKTSHVPIYEHFTPSRLPTESDSSPSQRTGSPVFNAIGTFSNRAESPGGSDDGLHLPPHLRAGGSGGKSGRVIDKLASENSRLHRELNEKTARLEEAQKTHETDVIAVQEAKESAMRHQHMYESNEAVLVRRDRKVEELKEALHIEKARRELAEKERREMADLLQQELSTNSKQLALEKEKRLHYQTQYITLEQAYKRGKGPWQPHVDRLSTDMERIATALKQLQTAEEEKIQQQSQLEDVHQQMIVLFETYKKEKNNLLGPVAGRVAENEKTADLLLEQMTEALGKMRYIYNVKRDCKSISIE